MAVTTLDRHLYSVGEAARLLGVPSQTLRRWLEGATISGRSYPPVIRPAPTGTETVTWGEFVEAGLLRGYRKKDVPLQKMRPFIERTRTHFGIPYPLAHHKPLVENRELVYRFQVEEGLDPKLWLVRAKDEQIQFAPPIQQFLEEVDFDEEGPVERLYPIGRSSPVVIDPSIAFGIPQIRGVRAELLAESVAAGETREAAAASWGVTPEEVDAALVWERMLTRAA